uniref:Uncharacterized protein n=1 Tax=Anguilla anguilla TaxID=7936 RepID=A0A0E9TGZ6_ANGAN
MYNPIRLQPVSISNTGINWKVSTKFSFMFSPQFGIPSRDQATTLIFAVHSGEHRQACTLL